MSSSAAKFKIAICGAGIGGLTCALALSKYPDIEVEVYEGATRLAEVGAGIGFFSRPWKIIRMLGLEDELLRATAIQPQGGPVPTFTYRKSDQAEGHNFHTLVTDGPLIAFHRADFQNVLLRHLPQSCRVHTSKRLRSYTQKSSPGDPIDLQFEDGTLAQCDVLIGADGLKSAVRRSLCTEKAVQAEREGRTKDAAEAKSAVDPLWSGMIAYRALIPAERLVSRAPGHRVLDTPTHYLGKNAHIVAYPIQHGTMIVFVASTAQHDLENTTFGAPWSSVVEKSVFSTYFASWEPEVQALIDCVDKPLRWAIHTVKPMGSFVSGRVALLGDAAHAMCIYQASGAGQAIEDAFILATVLGHRRTTHRTLSRALSIYDEIRRPRALQVQEKSRLNGQYYTLHVDGVSFDGASGCQLWETLQDLGKTITKEYEWAWTTSIDGMLEDTIMMIES